MDNYFSLILFNLGFLVKLIFITISEKTTLDVSDIMNKVEENVKQVEIKYDGLKK